MYYNIPYLVNAKSDTVNLKLHFYIISIYCQLKISEFSQKDSDTISP